MTTAPATSPTIAPSLQAHMHEGEKGHPLSHKLLFWGGAAAIGIVVLPHLLPLIGIGEFSANYTGEVCFPADGPGSGVTGAIANFFSEHIPLIGDELAKGGWVTALTSSVVGIGGVLLGNFIDKKSDGSSSLKWGPIIKWSALATSLLVSLPALLPALSMGISFLGSLGVEIAEYFGMDFLESTELRGEIVNKVTGFFGTLPGAGEATISGFSGTSALWPHLLTCGGVVGGLNFTAKKAVAADVHADSISEGTHQLTYNPLFPVTHQNIVVPLAKNPPSYHISQAVHEKRLNEHMSTKTAIQQNR